MARLTGRRAVAAALAVGLAIGGATSATVVSASASATTFQVDGNPILSIRTETSRWGLTPGEPIRLPWSTYDSPSRDNGDPSGIYALEVKFRAVGGTDPSQEFTVRSDSYPDEHTSGVAVGIVPTDAWAWVARFEPVSVTWRWRKATAKDVVVDHWVTYYADGRVESSRTTVRAYWNRFGSLDFLTGTAFADVSPLTTAAEEVQWMHASGVSRGFQLPDGRREYRGHLFVDRGSMAAFMYRLSGSPTFTPPARSPFTDVKSTHSFYKEIMWLAARGISRGWTSSDGTKTFRPSSYMAREHMAAFLFRLAGSPSFTPPKVSPFADIATTHPLYREVTWLAATRITLGYAGRDGQQVFRGSREVSRTDMAFFMFRFDQL